MKFSVAAIILAAASFVAAENHTVIVGLDDQGKPALKFTPDQVAAKTGDFVIFEFHVKNHTVTQSSFKDPCTRQRNTATNELGVDSGFLPVAKDAKEIPVWTIQVMQEKAPIWMFCNQGKGDQSHCNQGMVFAINAPAEGEKSFAKWVELAKTANHPNPEDGVTADFTPPPSEGAAPPAGTDAPAQSNGTPAPSGSDSAAAPPAATNSGPGGAAPSGSPSSGAPSNTSSAGPSVTSIGAEQDNATTNPGSGALATLNVPGAGVALSLAGLLAGLLL